MKPIISLVIAALAFHGGNRLAFEGILGNSGEQGPTLVRFGPEPRRGMGVALDRRGSLWDRAGAGVLNRYAPDGRLLASYRMPAGEDHGDKLTAEGDFIVFRAGGRVFALKEDAPPGSEARQLGEAEAISFGSSGGRLAVLHRRRVELLDPGTGDRRPALENVDAHDVEMDAGGAIYLVKDWTVRKFAGGREVLDGWPRKSPGERPQLLEGAWFGHSWHGTIRRFGAALEPEPGVVLGGASGSFIGHLDQNSELVNGRGMARLRPDLYAVSGMWGVMHLLEWDGYQRRMRIVRRIGAVQACRGIGVDRKGRVWWHAGSWRWEDAPDAPLEDGVNPPEHPGVGQVVMLPGDAMCAAGMLWGRPTFYRGPLSGEVKTDRIEKGCAYRKEAAAAAALVVKGRRVLLTADAAGKGEAFFIGDDGAYQGEAGPVALRAAAAGEWTSLAVRGDGALMGACGGAVVELAADGNDWREARRWSSWGPAPADRFGGRIYVAADEGRLWAADTERHRVICFDLGTGRPLGTFGACDRPGADLASLDRPTVIAARGRRGVVYDSGNQRLVRLMLR